MVTTGNHPHNSIFIYDIRHKLSKSTVETKIRINFLINVNALIPWMGPVGMLAVAHIDHINLVVGLLDYSNHGSCKRCSSFHGPKAIIAYRNRYDLGTRCQTIFVRLIGKTSRSNRCNVCSMAGCKESQRWILDTIQSPINLDRCKNVQHMETISSMLSSGYTLMEYDNWSASERVPTSNDSR